MRRTLEPTLVKWKDQTDRLPIILRGARQVGKSFLIEKFGKENFDSLIIANFELQPELVSCFDNLDPVSICSRLEIILKAKITPGKTLLFLDEIQNCPKAIMALRYFKEKLSSLHVIAAGSLLEFALHDEQFSFPVGRVQFLYLKPVSFFEYLISQNNEPLINYIEQVDLNTSQNVIHEHLLKICKEYALIGGMPSVVKKYLDTHSFLECQQLLISLLETYRADFPKYATKTQYKHLQLFFDKAPELVAQNFKYSHISTDHRSNDLKVSLEQLGWAGLLHRVLATSASGIPLNMHAKENKFKLLFLDLGLLNSASSLDFNSIWENEIIQINAGALAEQFVGQELLAYANPFSNQPLYYWERDKKGALAKVDYVIQIGSRIIPIEVKAGTTGTLKSLNQFLNEKQQPFGIRISQHPLSFHDRILSVPFYLISQLNRLVQALDLS